MRYQVFAQKSVAVLETRSPGETPNLGRVLADWRGDGCVRKEADPADVKVTVSLDVMVRLSHTVPVSSRCLVANAPSAVPERSTTKFVLFPVIVNEYAARDGNCSVDTQRRDTALRTRTSADETFCGTGQKRKEGR